MDRSNHERLNLQTFTDILNVAHKAANGGLARPGKAVLVSELKTELRLIAAYAIAARDRLLEAGKMD